MRKARFTACQVIHRTEVRRATRTVKDVCREAGMSAASLDNRQAKYGQMGSMLSTGGFNPMTTTAKSP